MRRVRPGRHAVSGRPGCASARAGGRAAPRQSRPAGVAPRPGVVAAALLAVAAAAGQREVVEVVAPPWLRGQMCSIVARLTGVPSAATTRARPQWMHLPTQTRRRPARPARRSRRWRRWRGPAAASPSPADDNRGHPAQRRRLPPRASCTDVCAPAPATAQVPVSRLLVPAEAGVTHLTDRGPVIDRALAPRDARAGRLPRRLPGAPPVHRPRPRVPRPAPRAQRPRRRPTSPAPRASTGPTSTPRWSSSGSRCAPTAASATRWSSCSPAAPGCRWSSRTSSGPTPGAGSSSTTSAATPPTSSSTRAPRDPLPLAERVAAHLAEHASADDAAYFDPAELPLANRRRAARA